MFSHTSCWSLLFCGPISTVFHFRWLPRLQPTRPQMDATRRADVVSIAIWKDAELEYLAMRVDFRFCELFRL